MHLFYSVRFGVNSDIGICFNPRVLMHVIDSINIIVNVIVSIRIIVSTWALTLELVFALSLLELTYGIMLASVLTLSLPLRYD